MTEHPAADVVPAARPTRREARLACALSVYELATRAGLAPRTILLIERGEATPRMATSRQRSAALGCRPSSIAWLGDPFPARDTSYVARSAEPCAVPARPGQ